MSTVEELVGTLQKTRAEFESWKNTLDLDAPQKHRTVGAIQAHRKTLPRPKTTEELKEQIKYRKTWRDAGARAGLFAATSIIKPVTLTPWQMDKAMAPDKRFQAPPGSQPIKVPQAGGYFGQPPLTDLSKRYRVVLTQILEKHKDYVQHPSKYQKPERLPDIEHPRGWMPTGTGVGEFKFETVHMMPRRNSNAMNSGIMAEGVCLGISTNLLELHRSPGSAETLVLQNPSSTNVAFKVVSTQIKTNTLDLFIVKPNLGILQPSSFLMIKVILHRDASSATTLPKLLVVWTPTNFSQFEADLMQRLRNSSDPSNKQAIVRVAFLK